MNLDAINAGLMTVGPFVAIGGVATLANYFVHLGETAAPAMPKRPRPQGAIRARASVIRPLPEVVEGEILPPADHKELTR